MNICEFVKTITEELVSEGAVVNVSALDEVDGRVTINIEAPKEERGKIIGKRGGNLGSLRNLVVAKAAANGDNRYYIMKVLD